MLSAYNAGPAGGLQQNYVDTTLKNAQTYGSTPSLPVAQTTTATPSQLQAKPNLGALNQTAFRKAQTDAEIGKLLKAEAGSSENPLLLSGLIPTKAPNPADYQLPGVSRETQASSGTPLPSGKTVAYVNPLSGFAKGRTDQGVDASAAPGTPIKAIGNARVLSISPNWYRGQPYVSYELLDGPQRGKVVFVAEQIKPAVKAGDTIRAGQAIGHYAPSGTGIEMGFGTKTPGQTLAKATTGYREGEATTAGKQFRRFVETIR